MAKHSRLYVLTRMIEIGLVPIFYNADAEAAAHVIMACLEGGAACIEFTNRGHMAHAVFEALIRRFQDDEHLILGVGSVVDPATASLYIQMGADFVVGPVLNPEVARVCNRRGVPYSPGCGSLSEISEAQELGVEICKIFPGRQVGGPAFVKAVRAPMPWTRIMPTGGVDATEESIRGWIQAGATCLGMGSRLITQEFLAAKDYAAITRSVRQVLGWIHASREGTDPLA